MSLRRDGLTGLRVLPLDGDGRSTSPFPEPLYTRGRSTPTRSTSTAAVRLRVHVAGHPGRGLRLRPGDPRTGRCASARPVPRLASRAGPRLRAAPRVGAGADDGTRMPISLVAAREPRATAPRPAVLYGYGVLRGQHGPLVLHRPAVAAGPWRECSRWRTSRGRRRDGPALVRRRTSCWPRRTPSPTSSPAPSTWSRSAGPRPTGWSPGGGSAGGLLMGAVANLAPDRVRRHRRRRCRSWTRSTSILDPSLPLTVTEWEEWGNPPGPTPRPTRYMKSLPPVRERRPPCDYPAILAMASLNDTRVLYHEPAKWVARLRALARDSATYLLQDRDGRRPRRPQRPLRRLEGRGLHQRPGSSARSHPASRRLTQVSPGPPWIRTPGGPAMLPPEITARRSRRR